jgi:hypothetical protein
MAAKRCRWSTQDDRILVETLLAQKAAGNQAQSGWKPTVWSAVAASLSKVAVSGQAKKTTTKCSDHWSNVRTRHTLIELRCR